jgi:hypothetical protein
MNPHKLPDNYSFYTFNKTLAETIAKEKGLRVGVYSLGDDRPTESMPFAVWTTNNGALLIDWENLKIWGGSL